MNKKVLILDDEENIRKDLCKYLSLKYEVVVASNYLETKCLIQSLKFDFAIVDLKIDYISDYGGIDVMLDLNRIQPKTKIIVLSAWELNDEIKKKLEKVDYTGYISKGGKKNYIEALIEELENIDSIDIKKRCFVIMPFSETKRCSDEEWNDIYNNTIKKAIEKSGFSYLCSRSNLTIGNIIKDILDNLNRADVVIADLTDKNPNVYYELGVRHALRDSTILITQSIDDVPFDLRPYALIEYDWKTQNGKKEFYKKIKDALINIEKSNIDFIKSPVREYLKLTL
jgi:response regulator RpfG family c-di-GMP phosphodiesterase